MKLCTYLNYGGNCRQAFEFYAEHLGGRIVMLMTHGQNPAGSLPAPDMKDAVLHARLELADSILLGADVPADHFQPMRSAYLTLRVESDTEAERIYTALAAGGRILMPIAETFFASRFAQVQDQFGINWMILRELPRSSG